MEGTRTSRIADWIVRAAESEIPGEVAHQATRLIYDTLTCCVAAWEVEGARRIQRSAARAVPAGPCTIIPLGATSSVENAAFANAEVANTRDLDDNFLYSGHMANTVVPVALAFAESEDLSGAELARAVAIGYEVAARANLALPSHRYVSRDDKAELRVSAPYWTTFNAIGAAAAAAAALHLDATQTATALGLAVIGAPLPSMARSTGGSRLSTVKYGAYGWHAAAACRAALLAFDGVDADTEIFDGERGLGDMVGAAWYDHDTLEKDLGAKWWILEASFKLEPAGHFMLPGMRALRELMAAQHLEAGDIEHIDVHLTPLSGAVHQRRVVDNQMDVQVSYYSMYALAALGIAGPRWSDPEVYQSAELERLMNAVELHGDEALDHDFCAQLAVFPYRIRGPLTRVVVRTTDGRTYEASARNGPGDGTDPASTASDGDLDAKFRDYALPHLPEDRAGEVPHAIWQLQGLPSIRGLLALFCISDKNAMQHDD